MLVQEAASLDGSLQKQAKLCFAHAETIIPLACLLGLFGAHEEARLPNEVAESHCSADSTMQQAEYMADSSFADTIEGNATASFAANAAQFTVNQACMHGQGSAQLDQCSALAHSWIPPLPRPPKPRRWHGSMIAPYGANIQFNLHCSQVHWCMQCPQNVIGFCCICTACCKHSLPRTSAILRTWPSRHSNNTTDAVLQFLAL